MSEGWKGGGGLQLISEGLGGQSQMERGGSECQVS